MSHSPGHDPIPPVDGNDPTPASHAPHAARSAGSKGHGSGGHGGHEGGSWIITYCDMVTLLMALFICLLTFASQHVGAQKRPRAGDSVLDLLNGEGLVAKARDDDLDAVVWRELPAKPIFTPRGSETAPSYSDPLADTTAVILKLLDEQTPGTLADSYTIRIPLAILFNERDDMSSSGAQILRAQAANLRRLPYTLYLRVCDRENLPRALAVAQHLVKKEGFHPSRLGIGLRDEAETRSPALWVSYMRGEGSGTRDDKSQKAGTVKTTNDATRMTKRE